MFIKRKSRAGKVKVYSMLLSFKISVTFFLNLTSRRTDMSVMKHFVSDITPFFTGHCPMVGANIQVCTNS